MEAKSISKPFWNKTRLIIFPIILGSVTTIAVALINKGSFNSKSHASNGNLSSAQIDTTPKKPIRQENKNGDNIIIEGDAKGSIVGGENNKIVNYFNSEKRLTEKGKKIINAGLKKIVSDSSLSTKKIWFELMNNSNAALYSTQLQEYLISMGYKIEFNVMGIDSEIVKGIKYGYERYFDCIKIKIGVFE